MKLRSFIVFLPGLAITPIDVGYIASVDLFHSFIART